MSVANQVRIIQDSPNQFTIKDCFIEESLEGGTLVGRAETLEGAVRIANEYMGEELCEYGLRIFLKNA